MESGEGPGGVLLGSQARGSAAAVPPSPFPKNKTLLWAVLGTLAGLALVGIIVYIVWTNVTVAQHTKCPSKVVPAIVLHQKAHAAIEVPRQPQPAAALPRGVTHTLLSRYPQMEQFDGVRVQELTAGSGSGSGSGSASAAAAVLRAMAAKLTGIPQEYAEDPAPLLPVEPVGNTGTTTAGVRVAYLRPSTKRARLLKGLPNQRLMTVVFFHGPGGGLRFPYFPYDIPATADRAVAWANVSPTGHVDPRTQFIVLPGTSATAVHFRDRPQR